MKKRIIMILPFIIMPIVIPVYQMLDNLIFVEIFGCGCVPIAQTNMLNIPYNANDLRLTVFSLLTVILSVWSVHISKTFQGRQKRVIYCLAVVSLNALLTMWVVKTFLWA